MARVTALVTVYNEETWLGAALDSLLAQSLYDVEVLVIDDGSTDRTPEVLARYDDPRLVVDRQPRIGRAAALAHGVARATGGYVAILDADDRAYPDRLARQADFLDANPDIAWVGCGEERQDSQRREHAVRLYPGDDAAIRRMATRCIPYCHSGAMFRAGLRDEGLNYDPTVPYLIDFEFFLRVAERHRVANLREALVMRRLRDASFFQRSYSRRRQNRALARLSASAVRRFGLPVWYYAFPLGRLAYDLVPTPLKRGVRRLAGLSERGGGLMDLLLLPVLGVGALAVPYALYRIVLDPTIGVYIFVALSSITMMPNLPVVGDRVAAADFVMGFAIMVATLRGHMLRPPPKGTRLLDQLALVFTVLCTVSSLVAVAGGANPARVILFMIIYIYGYLCFRLMIRLIDTPEKLRALCLWWLAGAALVVVVGVAAGTGIFRPEWTHDDFSGRVSATMKFANQIPSYVGPALFVLVYVATYRGLARRYQIAALTLLAGGVFVMLGTGSRTSFAITVFAIVFAFATISSARSGTVRKGAITASLVLGCFAFVSFAATVWNDQNRYSLGGTSPFERPIRMLAQAFEQPGGAEDFAGSRVSEIAVGLGNLHNHPIFGTGSGMFTQVYGMNEIHNTYVSILVENGMFAFVTFILWWIALGLTLLRRGLNGPSPHARYVARLALGAFVALSLYQLTMNGMRQRPFWFVPALAVAATCIVRRAEREEPSTVSPRYPIYTGPDLSPPPTVGNRP